MPSRPAERATGSLLRPGIDPEPGSWYCLSCPMAQWNLDNPDIPAGIHHRSTGHPTVAVDPREIDG